MESRPEYAISYERTVYEMFLSGGPTPPPTEIDWWRPWLDWVRDLAGEGRSLQRVRIVDTPLTAYQRFSAWGGRWNTEAGEKIVYLPRAAAHILDIPTSADWWLFDDTTLVLLKFGSDGSMIGQELERDPSTIAKYCRWRDKAMMAGVSAEIVTDNGGGE